MVHTAFNSVSIIEKLPLRIECIEAWASQSRLLVGTTEGVLFIYEIKEKNVGGKGPTVTLVDAQKTFARKPITKLSVIEDPKYNILISLSDGFISVHDLSTFALKFVIGKSRGCHLYAVDETKSPLTICAAIKRKLVIFTWENGDFVETKELAVPQADSAKSLVWCGESVCIGFKKEYNLISLQTGAMSELFPTGKSGIPIATLLPNNEQILLGRDEISIFIGYDGKPTRKYGLTWSEAPLVLGYSYPYVLAVMNKGVEVRSISGNSNLVQSISLKASKFLAIKGNKNEHIYIAAQNHIWMLAPVPILNQVDQLVAEREYEEALQLCECVPNSDSAKEAKIAHIKMLYTYHLFCQGQFERAMDYFKELQCDPLQVIGLYRNLLPKGVKAQYSNYPIEIPDLAGAALDKGLHALAAYLSFIRPNYLPKQPQSTPSPSAISDDDYANTSDVLTIIDTSLLKAYIVTDESGLAELVKNPMNYCHVKESEKVLTNYKKDKELVMLYKSKGLHRNALELLSKLGQTKGSSLCGAIHSVQYMRELKKENFDLITEFSKWILQTSPEEALTIFTSPRPEGSELPATACLAHIKPWAPQLVVPFLEYLIHSRKDKTPDFHNELIYHYLDTVQALRRDSFSKPTGRVIAGSEPGLLGSTRKKLLTFLSESQYYTPEKMFNRFPSEDLFEERAILLSKIGQHDKALHIYAHKLKDFRMAETYCAKNYSTDKEESRDVYLSLLRVYLKPPTQEGQTNFEPMLAPALELLNKYYQYINIPKALELLPGNTPINQLSGVFESVIRDSSTNRRNNQVVKNLLKSENLQIREQLIRARSRVVTISEDRMCPVCNKKLGPSAFACYPNGVVVHYACCKDKNVCPVTKTIFNSTEAEKI